MKKTVLIGTGLSVLAIAVAGLFFMTKKESPLKADYLNLLVITLDTMRADRIGAYGYDRAETPNLDDLARKGVMFENCYAPVPLTLPAHCSLFTGRYSLTHGVRNNGTFYLDEEEITLAEMMRDHGFETYAVVAAFVLLSKFGLDQGFSLYEDSLNADELLHNFYSEIPAEAVYSKFSRWLQNRPNQRFLAWVHFYDPHAPYTPPENFRKVNHTSLSDLYDGEVAYTDVYVGKMIDDLLSENLLNKTLVVIVGDHGEAFGEHEEYGHSVFCYEENLKVPLIFYNPVLFPVALRVQNRVNLVDMLPTVLDLYGIDTPAGVQGRSLVRLLEGKREKQERTLYVESLYGQEEMGWAPLTGIIDGPYKYISLPEPELYNLRLDPQEKSNLFSAQKEVAREKDETLRKMVLDLSAARSARGGDSRRELTAEDRRRLESLGYISAFSGRTEKALDPKKGIKLHSQFTRINTEIDREHFDAAEDMLKGIAAQNPNISFPEYFELLSKVYEKRKDQMGVVNTWTQALDAFPENSHFKISLAYKLFQLENLDRAAQIAQDILHKDAKYSQAYILLGSIAEKQNQTPQALDHFRRALELEPNNIMLKISYARMLIRDHDATRAQPILQDILDDDFLLSNPQNVNLISKVGILLAEMNWDDRALQILQKASQMPGAGAETWNYLGVVYYREKNYDQALEAYQRAVTVDPKFASAHNNLGSLYLSRFLEKKDPALMDKALEAFNSAINNDSRFASAYNGRASAYGFSGQLDRAIQDWNRALELRPDFIDVYFNLGITYLRVGNKPAALDILSRCKQTFDDRLPQPAKERLERLIAEASR